MLKVQHAKFGGSNTPTLATESESDLVCQLLVAAYQVKESLWAKLKDTSLCLNIGPRG